MWLQNSKEHIYTYIYIYNFELESLTSDMMEDGGSLEFGCTTILEVGPQMLFM